MFTIKNKTRVLAAAAVMASSLVVLGASGVASSAAAAPKCYAVVNGAVKAAAPTTTSPLACPAGYQSSVSAAVLGTGLPGDAAASMPSGDSATLAMNGSSFVYPFVVTRQRHVQRERHFVLWPDGHAERNPWWFRCWP